MIVGCNWSDVTAGSEYDLAAQLQLSIGICLAGTNLTEVFGVVDIVPRLAEDRMVEEVEGFGAELELLLMPYGERSNDRGV